MAWNLVGLTRLLRDASGLLADGDRAPAGTEAADSTSPIPSTAEPTHPTRPGYPRFAWLGYVLVPGDRAGQ